MRSPNQNCFFALFLTVNVYGFSLCFTIICLCVSPWLNYMHTGKHLSFLCPHAWHCLRRVVWACNSYLPHGLEAFFFSFQKKVEASHQQINLSFGSLGLRFTSYGWAYLRNLHVKGRWGRSLRDECMECFYCFYGFSNTLYFFQRVFSFGERDDREKWHEMVQASGSFPSGIS